MSKYQVPDNWDRFLFLTQKEFIPDDCQRYIEEMTDILLREPIEIYSEREKLVRKTVDGEIDEAWGKDPILSRVITSRSHRPSSGNHRITAVIYARSTPYSLDGSIIVSEDFYNTTKVQLQKFVCRIMAQYAVIVRFTQGNTVIDLC